LKKCPEKCVPGKLYRKKDAGVSISVNTFCKKNPGKVSQRNVSGKSQGKFFSRPILKMSYKKCSIENISAKVSCKNISLMCPRATILEEVSRK